MAAIRRCPRIDDTDANINAYCTEDGTQIELCEDCTADLLDSLIVQTPFSKVNEWLKEAEQDR